MNQCPKCGTPVKAGRKFCTACGTPLQAAPPPQPQAPPGWIQPDRPQAPPLQQPGQVPNQWQGGGPPPAFGQPQRPPGVQQQPVQPQQWPGAIQGQPPVAEQPWQQPAASPQPASQWAGPQPASAAAQQVEWPPPQQQAAPAWLSQQPAASGGRCARCGYELRPGVKFCQGCGQPAVAAPYSAPAAGPSPAAQPQAAAGGISANGIVAAAIVFAVCCAVCYLLWPLVGLPALAISSLVPAGGCTGVRTGTTEMYICSAKVALLKLVGPIVVTALVFIFRTKLAKGVATVSAKLPADWRFALPSLLASLLFTLSWAAIHAQTADRMGLMPQRIFPALIGLFTFVVGRFGPQIQSAMSGFFDTRDKFPKFLMVLGAIAVPIVISFVLTNQERVSEPALKEQLVVLISMITGYLALTPRLAPATPNLDPRPV